MKKILSLCLVILTSFSLCACSSEERKETNNQTKTEEKIYGVGETTTYKKDGQERVHFTVNSVSNTSDPAMNLRIVNQNKSLSFIILMKI